MYKFVKEGEANSLRKILPSNVCPLVPVLPSGVPQEMHDTTLNPCLDLRGSCSDLPPAAAFPIK